MHTVISFDLDGTLLDTSEGIFNTAQYVMTSFDKELLDDEQLRRFVGPPLRLCFRDIAEIEPELVDEAVHRYRTYYSESGGMVKAEIYANMVELLQALKERDYQLAVATNKNEKLAHTVLDHFGLDSYFDYIGGMDEEGTLTKSDIIIKVLNHFELKEGQKALMIGDTHLDQEGSQNTGIDFVAVKWGFGFNSDTPPQQSSSLIAYIEDPLDLLAHL